MQCDIDQSEVSHSAVTPLLVTELSVSLHTSQQTPSAFHQAEQLPKIALPVAEFRSSSNTWYMGPPYSERHLYRFSRFCTAHPCAQHTDRQADRHTHHAMCGICSDRSHLCNACNVAQECRNIRLDGVVEQQVGCRTCHQEVTDYRRGIVYCP